MRKTVVINAVGLTRRLLGQHTPRLCELAGRGRTATIGSVLPAVTCSVQSTYLTGAWPGEHGIVANGWYFRDECEIKFWRQSNTLVQRPKVWEIARREDPTFTCANLFWWYNMYSSADYAVTPRPMYPADGRKLPDVWTWPLNLRHTLQEKLGQFPLFQFWGPATSIRATQWIADAAIHVDQSRNPTLTLVYLPHLDYCLQRTGPGSTAAPGGRGVGSARLPGHPRRPNGSDDAVGRGVDPAHLPPSVAEDLRQLDAVSGQLIDHYSACGARIIVLSEYGITPVSRPVHLNRLLRCEGLIAVRDEMGHELLDPGASAAFAVADHQVAHIYVNDPTKLQRVREIVAAEPGVDRVLDAEGKQRQHLDHPRSGELVAIAAPDAWFTYYYWLDELRRPDFARTVDIHRKPGYDPAELFLDPSIPLPKLKIAWTLLRKKLGFRTLMEVIPTSADLIQGSHGHPADDPADAPLLMTDQPHLLAGDALPPTQVMQTILDHLRAG